MTIQVIFGSGATDHLEDGWVVQPPFYGAIDGDSAPFSPSHPRKLFMGGFTGGQMVKELVQETFTPRHMRDTLEANLLQANAEVRNFQHDEENLAGASLAFAEVRGDKVVVITVGDSFAWWLSKSGKAGMTSNKVYKWEGLRLRTFAKCLRQAQGDKGKAWDIYYPFYVRFRKKEGVAFASMNGKPSLPQLWHRREIPVRDLVAILLFTDGFVDHKSTRHPRKLAASLAEVYSKAGILGILRARRKAEKKSLATSHSAHFVEATCVEIVF